MVSEPVTGEPALPDDVASHLSEEAVFSAFRQLPAEDQKNFIRWVTTVDSEAERLRRTLILREALAASPLAWEQRPDLPNRRSG